MKHLKIASVAVVSALGASGAWAQQTVPFANGAPVAPQGLNDIALGAGPFNYRTAEQQSVRVTVFVRGIEYPMSLAFLPNGDLLFLERAGRLRIIRNGQLDPKPIEGVPATQSVGRSGNLGAVHGFMSMVLHPKFAENKLLYFSHNKVLPDGKSGIYVVRARLENDRLQDLKELIGGAELRGMTSLAMSPDAKLWIGTAGGAGDSPQDLNSLTGKVLRLNDDGSVPSDNPFVGKAGARPEVYSLGHRAPLALTVHPVTNQIYMAEMGPNGGDEINLIKAGANYGWPKVSLGRTYPGPWQAKEQIPTHEGFEPPLLYWMPSISVSGLTFYTGDKLPKWKGDLFVGGLRYAEVPGTGRLDRVLLNDKMEELRRESLLLDLHQRIRDVKQGPDGFLYVATDEPNGAILRIEPAP